LVQPGANGGSEPIVLKNSNFEHDRQVFERDGTPAKLLGRASAKIDHLRWWASSALLLTKPPLPEFGTQVSDQRSQQANYLMTPPHILFILAAACSVRNDNLCSV